MVPEEILKAGRIGREGLEYGASLIKKGASCLEVAEKVEEFIRKNGCIPAFPVGLSKNQTAAHYTPYPNDEQTFEDDVVKIDVGACCNGYIADNAATIDLTGENKALVDASREAVNAAVEIARPGVELRKIGAIIDKIIIERGFRPIRNLSGHGLGRYTVHSGISIPNFDNGDKRKLEKGMLIAIEPFATTGSGMVQEAGIPSIFKIENVKPVRDSIGRIIIKKAEAYQGMPFASRWLGISQARINISFREMAARGIIHQYPPLNDTDKGIVSQAEHTVYVDEEPIITTKS